MAKTSRRAPAAGRKGGRPVQSWDEVDALLARIAQINLDEARLRTEAERRCLPILAAVNQEVTAIRDEVKPGLDLLDAEREDLAGRLQEYARARKVQDFGKPLEGQPRTKDLAHGSVWWRLAPAALKFVRPIQDICAALRAMGLRSAIVVEERPSREQLHALYNAGKVGDETLKELGVRRTQPDEFGYEAKPAGPAAVA
jgi:phage host-nuclease inhibitor protein Gam